MRIPGLLGVGLGLAACSPALDTGDVVTRAEVGVDTTEVQISDGDEVAALKTILSLAPRATALRASSDTVHLRVGEIAQFRVLPLTMFDSTGAALGALPVYDLVLGGVGVVETTDAGIRGVKPGLQSVTFRIPQLFRGRQTRPQPSAVLQFLVHP
jgi:hypothetical protein